MADKLSSPSSSSSSGRGTQATPPKVQGRDSEICLLVSQHPPLYVFPNEFFEFKVGLHVPKNICDSPPENVDIVVTLQRNSSGSNKDVASEGGDTTPPSLWIDESKTRTPMRVSPSKPCLIRCRINASSTKHIRRDKRASYYISISTRGVDRGISAVHTLPIQLVNFKIRITTDAHWSNVWYKDEGGRDKCMEVVAELVDKDNRRHKEKVPLKLTLCYVTANDNVARVQPTNVTNQEILRMLGSASKMQTDKSTGTTTIRFRIEDVSKNHQGQDFILQISPEYRKGFWDVGPGYTPSVSVRSKRNKRQRSSTGRAGGPERRASPTAASSMTFGGIEHEQQRPVHSLDSADLARLRDAIKGVANWTEEVVNGLYPLQWQIIGYAPHPDGSPDYNHPYHSMPNPNASISRLLSMYTESTREQLWVLTQAIEQAGPNYMREDSPYAGMLEHREEDAYGPPLPHTGTMQPQPPGHSGVAGLVVPPPPPSVTRVQGGMHPSVASEAFRKAPPTDLSQRHPPLMHYPPSRPPQQHTPIQQPQHPQQYYRHPTTASLIPHTVVRRSSLEENETTPFDTMHRHHRRPSPASASAARSGLSSDRGDEKQQSLKRYDPQDEDNRESEVEYVLAKQYNALRTGERLGFPAYNTSMEILGFYRESNSKVGVGQFVPISRHADAFGPLEFMQASEILQKAIQKKSRLVHALKDWGSINNLVDHVLVYDWSKDIGHEGGHSTSRSDNIE